MWHLDIPKTRQYDHGKVEVLAKNSLGEAYACTQLIVKNRHDDYRALLKNSPRRKKKKFYKTQKNQKRENAKKNFLRIRKKYALQKKKKKKNSVVIVCWFFCFVFDFFICSVTSRRVTRLSNET